MSLLERHLFRSFEEEKELSPVAFTRGEIEEGMLEAISKRLGEYQIPLPQQFSVLQMSQKLMELHLPDFGWGLTPRILESYVEYAGILWAEEKWDEFEMQSGALVSCSFEQEAVLTSYKSWREKIFLKNNAF